MSRIKRCRPLWCWKFALRSWLVMGSAIGEAVLQTFAFSFNCAFAQITPDSTLPNNSRVTTQNNIRIIEGGTQAGSNLFHSFQEFSVPTNSAAYFNNTVDIQNVISRVTGGSVSNINGLIGTNGTANLFLINPNGIIFGANASLNVGGSFVASTANALQFGNIGFFSATDQNIPSPLLTINPSALLFNQINQNGAIQNNSIAPTGTDPAGFDAFGLRVPDGRSLLLVGGNVSMDGGQLNAFGGRVELGGLGESGSVTLDVDGDNLSLRFPENIARTSVSLTNQAGIYVTGAGDGNIAVNASNLEILGGTILTAGIGQGLGTPEAVAGDIRLNTTGEIKVAGTGSSVSNLMGLESKGNGGNITIDSGSFSLQDGAQIAASTLGQGNAGNVNINVTGAVDIAGDKNGLASGINSFVQRGAVGNGGNITIDSASLSLRDRAQIAASTLGQGNTGNVTVRAKNAVSLADNAYIFSTVEAGSVGKGGNIDINAAALSLIDGANLITITRRASATQPAGQGDAGNVNVKVSGKVDIAGEKNNFSSGISTSVEAGTVGNGGNITIDSGSFSLRDGAQISASTLGQGNAGNVIVRAKNAISLADANILGTVGSGSVGKGGNIDINATSLSLKDGAQLATATRRASDTLSAGWGDAGNVNVKVTGTVDIAGRKNRFFSGINSLVQTGAVGNGGNITIDSGSFSLRDGALLNASTLGQGNAGNVTVRAKNAIYLADANIFSMVGSGGVGKGGNIDINAATLSLIDSANLQTITARASDSLPAGWGDAGNVNVKVTGAVNIAGKKNGFASAILSRVERGAVGNGGNITIDSGSFSLRDGAFLSAETVGQGNAGNVRVRALNAVSLANTAAIFSTVEAGAVGKGGNIDINAASFSLTDGAQMLTATRWASKNQPAGRGDAGNVNVKVTGAVNIAGEKNGFVSGISSRVEEGTVGNGGNITIDSGSFSLQDGAYFTASTLGQGNAGAIKVNAADFVRISGKSANFTSGLFVNSQSPTGTAGDIVVNSPRVTLDNGGTINAESASGNGGDINLQTDLLLLRRGASISTTAGTAQAGGNGGNITINAPSGFIVAVPRENSDITANAYTGSGGRVDIQAFGIYGIQPHSNRTSLSDITASSEFGVNGTVELNTPDIDPNSGLVNLPAAPVDSRVAQGCTADSSQAQSKFIITGRGGLPPNPGEALSADAVQVDLVTLNPGVVKPPTPAVSRNPINPTPNRIVEATGWVIAANGDVILTLVAPTVTPHDSWQRTADCSVFNQRQGG
ncbi:filamentous hemagglutinin N-terminal domain-containing protein [Nostoc sp. ChiSLP03a]|uniref:two-partner secretion domain-containing protein n=1 Tax=Nostoc sp. ChiSLP03a TaxID=3075380 RepID=UPI002AD485C9|nr:filamentous hemagglutinin N-terminal domain-containing protein [Nostoc sp. ChiSLP03a]MDZ8216243.1 filamentous hemagglutinin N-terminal domain-containing protein [Nostoc sp. ChiSLP03a]